MNINNQDRQNLSSQKSFNIRKLIAYFVRTMIIIALYCFFWEIPWVKWTLILYIPFNLFGLFLVLNEDKFIQEK